jgi:predicted HicB family RNase H-like nuclease
MISVEQQNEVGESARHLYARQPDWVTFYREILGLRGIIRLTFPTREMRSAFEQTEAYQEILRLLTRLREHGASPTDDEETRVITVRLPRSLHEAIRVEAHECRTSMNKLCISKLLQMIDGEQVPGEP